MSDIGNLTWGIRDNTTDICDAWINQPGRRREFGPREMQDIRAAHLKLGLLISAIDALQTEHSKEFA